MVTYGDYFSRKVLYRCGVAPNKALLNKEENAYAGMQRTDNIRAKMSEIYQTLYDGYTQQNGSAQKEDFNNLQIERKIVSAFYDSGVLNNAERDYFQTQTLQGLSQREQICVEEANLSLGQINTQKVDAPIKTPMVRKI